MSYQNGTSSSSSTISSRSKKTLFPRLLPSSLDNSELLDELNSQEPLLCLAPLAKTIIHRPMVNLTDFSNSYSICLNSYEDRIGAQIRGEELAVEKILTHKEKAINGKRLRLDSGGEGGKESGGAGAGGKKTGTVTESNKRGKGAVVNTPAAASALESNSDGETSKGATATTPSTQMDVGQSEEESARPNSPVDIQMLDFSAIATDNCHAYDRMDLFSDNSEDNKDNKKDAGVKAEKDSNKVTETVTNVGTSTTTSKPTSKRSNGTSGNSSGNSNKSNQNKSAASFKPLISDEVMRKIREGWTATTCGDLTFGDLYVMFGNDFKINLEYKWVAKVIEEKEKKPVEGESEEVVGEAKESEKVTTEEAVKTEEKPEVDKETEQMMGRRLGQLLMIANLMEKTQKKKECSCDRSGRMKVSG